MWARSGKDERSLTTTEMHSRRLVLTTISEGKEAVSGLLGHAQEFRKGESYEGRDGNLHYELVAEHGDEVSMSNLTWEQVKEHGTSLGISKEAWPQYPSSIDIDLDDLTRRNDRLRRLMAEIEESQVVDKGKLHQIWRWIRDGEKIFFAET